MEDLESTEGLDWERIATKVTIFHYPVSISRLLSSRSIMTHLPYPNVLRRSARSIGWVIDIQDSITLHGPHLKLQRPKHWLKAVKGAI